MQIGFSWSSSICTSIENTILGGCLFLALVACSSSKDKPAVLDGGVADANEVEVDATTEVQDASPRTSMVVFVSSTIYRAADLAGLSGADTICNALAEDANLPGQFKAWLSNASASPADRFDQSDKTYNLVDSTLIANNWADLVDGVIETPINLTEIGEAPSTNIGGCPNGAWTSTDVDGTFLPGTGDCNNWSGLDAPGGFGPAIGNTTETTRWSWGSCAISPGGCDSEFALMPIYCFQQD